MSEFSPQDDVPIQLRTDLNDTLIWIAEELNESFDSLAEEAISNDTLANGNSLSTSQKQALDNFINNTVDTTWTNNGILILEDIAADLESEFSGADINLFFHRNNLPETLTDVIDILIERLDPTCTCADTVDCDWWFNGAVDDDRCEYVACSGGAYPWYTRCGYFWNLECVGVCY